MVPCARTPSDEPTAEVARNPGPEPEMDEAMAVFRARAAVANRQRALVIAEAFDAMSGGNMGGDERAVARAATHTIAGSAGTFGFNEASRLARGIEEVWDALYAAADNPKGGGVDEDELLQRGLDLLARLREALGEEPAPPPQPCPGRHETERP